MPRARPERRAFACPGGDRVRPRRLTFGHGVTVGLALGGLLTLMFNHAAAVLPFVKAGALISTAGLIATVAYAALSARRRRANGRPQRRT